MWGLKQVWTSIDVNIVNYVKSIFSLFAPPPESHPASEVHRRFPNDPFFMRLLSTAARHSNRVVVNDPTRHVQADYTQLLRDVSVLRQTLCESLPECKVDRSKGVVRGQSVRICLLAPVSYHCIVALLAIAAIGAAAVVLRKIISYY